MPYKLQFKLTNSAHERELSDRLIFAIARGLPHDGSPYRKGQNPVSALIRLMNGETLTVTWVSEPDPVLVSLLTE